MYKLLVLACFFAVPATGINYFQLPYGLRWPRFYDDDYGNLFCDPEGGRGCSNKDLCCQSLDKLKDSLEDMFLDDDVEQYLENMINFFNLDLDIDDELDAAKLDSVEDVRGVCRAPFFPGEKCSKDSECECVSNLSCQRSINPFISGKRCTLY